MDKAANIVEPGGFSNGRFGSLADSLAEIDATAVFEQLTDGYRADLASTWNEP
jgi:hypothetical protein